MVSTSETGDATGGAQRSRIVWISGLVSGLILISICVFRVLLYTRVLNDSWYFAQVWLWVIVTQFVALGVLFSCLQRPRGLLNAMLTMLTPAVVFAAVGLLLIQQFDAVALWLLDLVLCTAFTVGWTISIVGPIVMLLLAARRRPNAAWESLRGSFKVWVMAFAFFSTAEVAARLLSAPPADVIPRLTLPEEYPPVDPDEFHIVALGGSTMLGFPYQPKISIPALLKEQLSEQYPDRRIRVTNLAVTGINFRKAADRLKELDIRPDLLLLYSGHNEYFHDIPMSLEVHRFPRRIGDQFLEWSRAYQLLAGVIPQDIAHPLAGSGESIIRESQYTAPIVAKRVQQFRVDLASLANHCVRHSLSTLWFLPATNEGVFVPNRSTCSRVLSQSEDEDLNRRYQDARGLMEQARYDEAQKRLQSLLAEYPEVAEVEYRIGVCCRQLGEFERARSFFQAAADHDRKPAYIIGPYREAIRSVAEEAHVELLDASLPLRRLSPSGLLDRHVIHDNVHPTLHSYVALAGVTAESDTVGELFGPQSVDAGTPLTFAELLIRRSFTAEDLALAYERTAYCLDTLAQMRVEPQRLNDAAQYERWGKALRSGEIQPGEQGTESFDDTDAAGVQFPE